jgi:hypothetical protein
MRNNCHLFRGYLEITLIALKCSLNVVAFTVDPHNCQVYQFRGLVVVDPNSYERFAFLLSHQSHYQPIVSKPNSNLFCDDAANDNSYSPVDFNSLFNQYLFLMPLILTQPAH